MELNQTDRSWIKDAVIYQIYPQSFNDTNGDGVGDLPGIIEKLDYIKETGFTLLWLNPLFDSPFNDAGYDIRDFYQIAARYGSIDDLKRLFSEAHKRGLRVCLDLVAGHSTVECEWFKQSMQIEPNAYSNYYIWTDHWGISPEEGNWISGYAPRNGNYRTNYFWSQPALNYGYANPNPENPWEEPITAPGPQAVLAELKQVMKFWLDLGCDGFRVDMADSLIKNDPDQSVVCTLWRENIFPWLRENYPSAVMVSEWGSPTRSIGTAEFDIDFMLHFGVPGYKDLFFKVPDERGNPPHGDCYFSEAGKGSLEVFLREYRYGHEMADGKGYISLPSANHDFQRMNYNRSPEEQKIALAFLLTWACIPSIYYGDEIGMRFIPDLPSKEGGYTRTGTRTPMQWSEEKNAGFSDAPESELYIPLDPHADRPNVADQLQDDASIYSLVKELLAIRKTSPGLRAEGDLEVLSDESQPYPLIYRRGSDEDQWVIALNPSGQAVEQIVHVDAVSLPQVIGSGVTIRTNGDERQFSLGPLSWGLFRIQK